MASATESTPSTIMRRAAVVFWALTLVWAAVIFRFSSLPGTQVPGRFSEVGHFGEYFVLGVLLYSALRASGRRDIAAATAIVIASLYAVSDEFHQHFSYMRTPDVVDWGVDTLGAACGVLAARIAIATGRRSRRERRPTSVEGPQ
jgi:VanZ family protein